MSKRKISFVFKIAIVICCMIGLISSIFETDSIIRMFSYYTTLSNIYVLVFYIITIICMIKDKDYTNSNFYAFFKGSTIVIIVLTFMCYLLYYNPLGLSLAIQTSKIRELALSSIFWHFVDPILVILDYIIFDTKGKFKKIYPIFWAIFPILYLIYAQVYASLGGTFKTQNGIRKYAYFFLDSSIVGSKNVFCYIALISVCYLALCYAIVLLDNLCSKKEK